MRISSGVFGRFGWRGNSGKLLYDNVFAFLLSSIRIMSGEFALLQRTASIGDIQSCHRTRNYISDYPSLSTCCRKFPPMSLAGRQLFRAFRNGRKCNRSGANYSCAFGLIIPREKLPPTISHSDLETLLSSPSRHPFSVRHRKIKTSFMGES